MFSFFYNNLNTVTKIKYFYKCKLKALESRVWTALVGYSCTLQTGKDLR